MVGARTVTTGFTLAAVGYALYALASDSGTYRWLNQAQVRWFGSHDSSWTFVLLLLGHCAVAALAAGVVSRTLGLERHAPPLSHRAQRALCVVVAVASAGACAGLAVHASAVADKDVVYEPLDLAGAGAAPRGRHVEIRGVAQPGWGIRIETDTSAVDYVPLTAPGWQPDTPVTYFGQLSAEDAGRGAHLSNRGFLVEGGVPSLACAGFAQRGLKLASPVFLLDPDTHAEVRPWLFGALGCGVLALGCVIAAIYGGRRAPVRRVSDAPRSS